MWITRVSHLSDQLEDQKLLDRSPALLALSSGAYLFNERGFVTVFRSG